MKVWTRFPFVRLLLPFIGGILLYGLVPYNSVLICWLVLIPFPFLLFFLFKGPGGAAYRNRWIFGVMLSVQVFLLGYTLSGLENQKNHRNHFSEIRGSSQPVYSAFLLGSPDIRANSAKCLLWVNRVYTDGKAYKVKGKLLAYAALDSLVDSLDYGVEILFSQQPEIVRPPANPGEFNYARYLSAKKVFHQVYLAKGSFTITGKGRGNFLKAFALEARDRLLETMLQHGITGREFAVAAALLIGYDDLLDASQRREYSGAGVVHILCVSGLHVAIVFMIADYLFFFLRKRKKAVWLRPLLIILVIWLYSLITGLAPSVLRASLMFTLITIGNSLSRHAHTYNTLAASAFILLIVSPGMLFDLGFQLSYAAVAGIVTFQAHLKQLFVPGNKFTGYIWGLIYVSLAAQLLTTPISIYYFHQFPNYFLIANLIAIPLSGVLIYSGVIFVALSFIPFLGKIAAGIVVAQIKLLNYSVHCIEGLPGAVSRNLYLSPFATLVLYLLVISCLMLYLQKKKHWFYLSVIACLLLAADYAAIAIRRSDQQMMIVHSLNRHTAISLISGAVQTVLADSAVNANPAMLNYAMDGFRVKQGIRQINIRETAGNSTLGMISDHACVMEKDGFFQFGKIRGVVLSPSVKLPEAGKQISVDYVILTSGVKINLQKLSSYFPGAAFIADVSNSNRKILAWTEEAVKLGLSFYSVRDSGALMVEIE